MDRIILAVVIVGGYIGLSVAAAWEPPETQPAAPGTVDFAERHLALEPDGGAAASWTADTAERLRTVPFERLPKPYAPR